MTCGCGVGGAQIDPARKPPAATSSIFWSRNQDRTQERDVRFTGFALGVIPLCQGPVDLRVPVGLQLLPNNAAQCPQGERQCGHVPPCHPYPHPAPSNRMPAWIMGENLHPVFCTR
jgi:hypothetical protein